MRPPATAPEIRTWTLSDGYEVQGRLWAPPRPREVLLYLHGIQSHGGWYECSGSALAGDDTVVLMPDRRGSGLNERDRGHVDAGVTWLRDVDELLDWATTQWPRLPVGMVGISWGGKLAAGWALQNPQRLGRMLLVTPGIYPAVDVGFARRVHIGVSLARGGRDLFEIPLSDPALFTENEAGRRFIAEDRLKLTHATARFLLHSARLDRRIQRAGSGGLAGLTTEVLLASDDRIIRNGPTRDWAQRVAGADAAQLVGAHTLEFANDPVAFDEFLRAWKARSPAAERV